MVDDLHASDFVNQGLADRYRSAIEACLGEPGRLIGLSKSGYRDGHPLHLAVFNANVCLEGGKVWWGDLDLTIDETRLADLAAQTGLTTYVLSESDGRFSYEDAPQLGRAVYSVTASGLTSFDHTHIERRADGALYWRPPVARPRYRRPARPRLWRFWRLEVGRECTSGPSGGQKSVLLYVGSRGRRRGGPLLALGLHRWEHVARGAWIEWTWYPSGRRSWAPSCGGRLKWHRGPIRPFVAVRLAPGVCTEVRVGFMVGRADPVWG